MKVEEDGAAGGCHHRFSLSLTVPIGQFGSPWKMLDSTQRKGACVCGSRAVCISARRGTRIGRRELFAMYD